MIAKLKRLLNGIEQAAMLGSKCQELERDNAELKQKNAHLWDSVNQKATEAAALVKEVSDLKQKVRLQTEADMVLTSLKIIQGAMRGEKKEQLSGLSYLQQQNIATLQGMGQGPYSYGGVLSALGLGGGYP